MLGLPKVERNVGCCQIAKTQPFMTLVNMAVFSTRRKYSLGCNFRESNIGVIGAAKANSRFVLNSIHGPNRSVFACTFSQSRIQAFKRRDRYDGKAVSHSNALFSKLNGLSNFLS